MPNGKVLVVGGVLGGEIPVYYNSCDLYDPSDDSWTATDHLATARANHTATLLPGGYVLVVGGENGSPLASTERYNLTMGWSNGGNLSEARAYHTATLLPNGRLLVAGGYGSGARLTSAQLYYSGSWHNTGAMLGNGRADHTATLLPDGTVLVAGGTATNVSGGTNYLFSCEIYNPITRAWSYTGSLNWLRAKHTATLLPNGKVLAAGGYDDDSTVDFSELYNSHQIVISPLMLLLLN